MHASRPEAGKRSTAIAHRVSAVQFCSSLCCVSAKHGVLKDIRVKSYVCILNLMNVHILTITTAHYGF